MALSDEHENPELTPFSSCACDRIEGQCRLLEEVYPFPYTCRVAAVDDPGDLGRHLSDRMVTFEIAEGEHVGRRFSTRVASGYFDGLMDPSGHGITVRLRLNRKLNLDDPQRPESVQPDEIAWEHVERVDAR